MADDLQKYIENYLKNTEPLQPIPTGIQKRLKSLSGIRAVLFDIYGTLLISASGDISNTDFSKDSAAKSLRECGFIDCKVSGEVLGRETVDLYFKTIRKFHEMKKKEEAVLLPEVDIIQVWEQVVNSLEQTGSIGLNNTPDYRRLAFIFEMHTNPVYPMPGLKEVIKGFASESAIDLGIISNSQFYTPIILNFFIADRIAESRYIPYFNNDLVLYSFQHERAKPDPKLFELSKQMLKRYGIYPDQVLYVGNDVLNDIYPAVRAGFHTALFAGDKRSLRLREEDDTVRDIVPDIIISELSQLKEVLL